MKQQHAAAVAEDASKDEKPLSSHPLQDHLSKQQQPNNKYRLQGDYFIMYGGDVSGNFSKLIYTAQWDTNFYIMSNDDKAKAIYAFDLGNLHWDIFWSCISHLPSCQNKCHWEQ